MAGGDGARKGRLVAVEAGEHALEQRGRRAVEQGGGVAVAVELEQLGEEGEDEGEGELHGSAAGGGGKTTRTHQVEEEGDDDDAEHALPRCGVDGSHGDCGGGGGGVVVVVREDGR